MAPTMMAQAGAVTSLGVLPLYVLTAPADAQTNLVHAARTVPHCPANTISIWW